jgi:alpha/beta superfamily hydrolase
VSGHPAGRRSGARRVDHQLGVAEDVEFFGDGGRLFGCRHSPLDGPGTATTATGSRLGVVICSPILADFGANYRREVTLARTLAAAGVSVQRFHPTGTGHSRGDRLDLSLPRMVDDALAAVDRLVETTGVESVALVGTRFAALAAAEVAVELGSAPLALWEPVVKPRRYFREGVRAHNVHQLKLGRPGIDDAETELAERGFLDVLGIAVGGALFHTEQDLRTALGDTVRPVLVVQFEAGEDLRTDLQQVVESLEAHRFAVTTANAATDENWWFIPDRTAPVDEVVDPTARWLVDQIDQTAPASRADRRPAPVRPLASDDPPEYPVFVPSSGGELLAVVTEPAPAAAANGLAVVMLRGAGWRPSSGPRRTQVTTARTLARRGLHGVRFSYHGIAESGGEDDEVVRLDRPYVPDTRAVVDWVAEQGLRPVLVGNCFGARNALAEAADDERVDALALLVPPVHDFEVARRLDRRPLSHFGRRLAPRHVSAVLRDPTRRKALGRTSRALLDLAGRRVRAIGGGRSVNGDHGPEWVSHRFLDQLATVLGRGVPVLFVYGEDDPYRSDFETARQGALGRLVDDAGDSVRIETVPGKVHGLTSRATQDAVLAVIDDWSNALLTVRP